MEFLTMVLMDFLLELNVPEAGDTPKKISYVFFELSYAPNRSPSPGRPHGTSIPRPDRLHIAKLRP